MSVAPPPPPATYALTPPKRSTATIALLLACIPLVVTSIAGACVGAYYWSRTRAGDPGRRRSIAATIVGGVSTLLVLVGLLVASIWFSESEYYEYTDESAVAERTGDRPVRDTDLEELAIGDCVDEIPFEGYLFAVVPCAMPHHGELIALPELRDQSWPGEVAVGFESEKVCEDAFEEVTGESSWDHEQLWVHYWTPVEDRWPGDRVVICMAVSLELREGSVFD